MTPSTGLGCRRRPGVYGAIHCRGSIAHDGGERHLTAELDINASTYGRVLMGLESDNPAAVAIAHASESWRCARKTC